MRPPICGICDKRMEMDDGGLVYFKLRSSDIEWRKRMEEKGMVGHPPYAEWFCENHYQKAKNLSHLPINEAIKKF